MTEKPKATPEQIARYHEWLIEMKREVGRHLRSVLGVNNDKILIDKKSHMPCDFPKSR